MSLPSIQPSKKYRSTNLSTILDLTGLLITSTLIVFLLSIRLCSDISMVLLLRKQRIIAGLEKLLDQHHWLINLILYFLQPPIGNWNYINLWTTLFPFCMIQITVTSKQLWVKMISSTLSAQTSKSCLRYTVELWRFKRLFPFQDNKQ